MKKTGGRKSRDTLPLIINNFENSQDGKPHLYGNRVAGFEYLNTLKRLLQDLGNVFGHFFKD